MWADFWSTDGIDAEDGTHREYLCEVMAQGEREVGIQKGENKT